MKLAATLALVVGALWSEGAEGVILLAALVTAIGVIWSKALAPLIFRPVGKALARGARTEAEQAIEQLVRPELDLLERILTGHQQLIGALLAELQAAGYGADLSAPLHSQGEEPTHPSAGQ